MLCSYFIISAFMNTTTLPICDKDSRSVGLQYHLQQGPAGKAISGHSRREIPFLLRKRYDSDSNSRTF